MHYSIEDIKSGCVKVALGHDLYPVGELVFETDGFREVSVFRYDPEWLNRPGAFALSPLIPLSEYPVKSAGDVNGNNMRLALPGVISDTIPDFWGRAIMDDYLHEINEFEYLLAVNDVTRQGALRFLDEKGKSLSSTAPPVSGPDDIVDIMHLHRDFQDGCSDRKKIAKIVGNAPGGARPKADFNNNGTLSIAKFPSIDDFLPIERMEVATLRLAARCGLRSSKAHLIFADTDLPITILKRFDRIGERRIHYISAQSFLGCEKNETNYYTDLVMKMPRHCGIMVPRELEELHNRIMFTILVSNQDDHLKNHGFLYCDHDRWMLSPAFDINPEPARSGYLETGISPDSGYAASIEAAIEAAPYFRVSEDLARARAAVMARRITAEWQGLCRNTGMSDKAIRWYKPAFEHPEMQLALGKLQPRTEPAELNRNESDTELSRDRILDQDDLSL